MANKKAKTRADLQREVAELSAQLAHVYHFADATLHKAGDSLVGSAVIVTMRALGGRELIPAVAIRDGLSAETIAAIRKDLARSYALAVQFKPKGA